MPTLKRFDEDAYRTTCDATVVARHPEGIELDATVFYARSGGQAHQNAGASNQLPRWPSKNGTLTLVVTCASRCKQVHGTRARYAALCTSRARGAYATPHALVCVATYAPYVGGRGASCPAPPARVVRPRPVRASRTPSAAAPGRDTCQRG